MLTADNEMAALQGNKSFGQAGEGLPWRQTIIIWYGQLPIMLSSETHWRMSGLCCFNDQPMSDWEQLMSQGTLHSSVVSAGCQLFG